MRSLTRRTFRLALITLILALAILPWLGGAHAQSAHAAPASPLSLSVTYMGYVYSLTIGISFLVALLIKLLSIALRTTRSLRVIY